MISESSLNSTSSGVFARLRTLLISSNNVSSSTLVNLPLLNTTLPSIMTVSTLLRLALLTIMSSRGISKSWYGKAKECKSKSKISANRPFSSRPIFPEKGVLAAPCSVAILKISAALGFGEEWPGGLCKV